MNVVLRSPWRTPALLILLSLVPVVMGASRIIDLVVAEWIIRPGTYR